jgi:hypothetical protein
MLAAVAQILPVEDAAKFAHMPDVAYMVSKGAKVNNAYVDALELKVTVSGKVMPVHTVKYEATGGILATVSFRGPRGGYYVGRIYSDAPSQVIYNKPGVDTNNKAAVVSGLRAR